MAMLTLALQLGHHQDEPTVERVTGVKFRCIGVPLFLLLAYRAVDVPFSVLDLQYFAELLTNHWVTLLAVLTFFVLKRDEPNRHRIGVHTEAGQANSGCTHLRKKEPDPATGQPSALEKTRERCYKQWQQQENFAERNSLSCKKPEVSLLNQTNLEHAQQGFPEKSAPKNTSKASRNETVVCVEDNCLMSLKDPQKETKMLEVDGVRLSGTDADRLLKDALSGCKAADSIEKDYDAGELNPASEVISEHDLANMDPLLGYNPESGRVQSVHDEKRCSKKIVNLSPSALRQSRSPESFQNDDKRISPKNGDFPDVLLHPMSTMLTSLLLKKGSIVNDESLFLNNATSRAGKGITKNPMDPEKLPEIVNNPSDGLDNPHSGGASGAGSGKGSDDRSPKNDLVGWGSFRSGGSGFSSGSGGSDGDGNGDDRKKKPDSELVRNEGAQKKQKKRKLKRARRCRSVCNNRKTRQRKFGFVSASAFFRSTTLRLVARGRNSQHAGSQQAFKSASTATSSLSVKEGIDIVKMSGPMSLKFTSCPRRAHGRQGKIFRSLPINGGSLTGQSLARPQEKKDSSSSGERRVNTEGLKTPEERRTQEVGPRDTAAATAGARANSPPARKRKGEVTGWVGGTPTGWRPPGAGVHSPDEFGKRLTASMSGIEQPPYSVNHEGSDGTEHNTNGPGPPADNDPEHLRANENSASEAREPEPVNDGKLVPVDSKESVPSVSTPKSSDATEQESADASSRQPSNDSELRSSDASVQEESAAGSRPELSVSSEQQPPNGRQGDPSKADAHQSLDATERDPPDRCQSEPDADTAPEPPDGREPGCERAARTAQDLSAGNIGELQHESHVQPCYTYRLCQPVQCEEDRALQQQGAFDAPQNAEVAAAAEPNADTAPEPPDGTEAGAERAASTSRNLPAGNIGELRHQSHFQSSCAHCLSHPVQCEEDLALQQQGAFDPPQNTQGAAAAQNPIAAQRRTPIAFNLRREKVTVWAQCEEDEEKEKQRVMRQRVFELLEENERLRARLLCRQCRRRRFTSIFLPCGHFACDNCAVSQEYCVCGCRIDEVQPASFS